MKVRGYRFILGWLSGLLIFSWPVLLRADHGGTILRVAETGPYKLTVIGPARPEPLQVGANEVTVLVGQGPAGPPVLQAQVWLTVEPLDQPGQVQTFPATHDRAANKLYYGAEVIFPAAGRWKLTVHVDGADGAAQTSFEWPVVQQQGFDYLRYLIPAGLVLLLILYLGLARRTKSRANPNLPEQLDELTN
jgi:hypothetical protein